MAKKLLIFGVGLIGGSVALALKANHVTAQAWQITGLSRDPSHLQEALALKIIDAAETDIAAAVSTADCILIATPVAQIGPILQSIQPHLAPHTIITDVGSTKNDVLATAQRILGVQFSQFVGGHPIAGAEKSGASAAKADLFAGKNVILTPAPTTAQNTTQQVAQLWEHCGANVVNMQAKTHDAIFAAVSHLPHLLAFALVNNLASRPNAEELFSFAASGFRDFTRIAGSHPEMWRDISLANKAALLQEIDSFEHELTHLKQLLINEDAKALQALFAHASNARNVWAASQK